MKRHARKQYFINKELQGRYIFTYFLFAFLGIIFFAVLLNILSADSFTIVYDNYHLQMEKTPAILFGRHPGAHGLFIVFGGILAVAVSLLLTHRVAGPLHKIGTVLDRMIEGDFAVRIRLRKRDEAKEIAEKLNLLNESVGLTMRKLNGVMDEMDVLLQAGESVERTGEHLGEIRKLALQARNLLAGYTWR